MISLRNPHQTETDAARDVPNTTKIENNREKQSTQYLMRFSSVPMSSGKGERDFINSIINYNLFLPPRNFQGRFSV